MNISTFATSRSVRFIRPVIVLSALLVASAIGIAAQAQPAKPSTNESKNVATQTISSRYATFKEQQAELRSPDALMVAPSVSAAPQPYATFKEQQAETRADDLMAAPSVSAVPQPYTAFKEQQAQVRADALMADPSVSAVPQPYATFKEQQAELRSPDAR